MVQLRLRGQGSGQGHRVNKRWSEDSSPGPNSPTSCALSCTNSTQASVLVALSTASQVHVMAQAALPKPLLVPTGGHLALGLAVGCYPGWSVGSGLLWVKLPGGPRTGRGQEVGRWAAGGNGTGESACCFLTPHSSSQGPSPIQDLHHLHSGALFPSQGRESAWGACA